MEQRGGEGQDEVRWKQGASEQILSGKGGAATFAGKPSGQHDRKTEYGIREGREAQNREGEPSPEIEI
jgi:hypothetical protein